MDRQDRAIVIPRPRVSPPLARAPVSITKLTAIGRDGRALGCHHGWYDPRRIQAGLGGSPLEEYVDAYDRQQHDPDR